MADKDGISFAPAEAGRLAEIARLFGDKPGYDKAMLRFAGRQATAAVLRIRTTAFSGQVLRRRTGHLAQSLEGKAGVSGNNIVIRAGVYSGPTLAYAAAQERGAKIVPKPPRRYLTVPTDKGGALTPAGVARYARAKDFPGGLTFMRGDFSGVVNGKTIRARAALFPTAKVDRLREKAKFSNIRVSTAFLAGRIVAHTTLADLLKKVTPVYLLLRRTTIPERAPIRKGMEQQLPAIVAGIEASLAAHYTPKDIGSPPAGGSSP